VRIMLTGVEMGAAIEQTGVPLAETYQRAAIAEQVGCTSLWMIQVPNQRETLTVLGGLAANTMTATLASSIVPFFSRPPVVMAQTALTLDEISGGRLMLGIGMGNPMVGEWMLGHKQGPPLQATREYLTIVTSLVRTGEVSYTGRWHSGNGTYAGPRRAELPVYLGTFGPKMVQLAGELADGLILWVCTPQYVRDVVMPNLRIGWTRRETPRGDFPITLMISVSVTDDAYERENFRRALAGYARVPAYRKMFEASGFAADLKAGRASDAMVDSLAAFGSEQHVWNRLAEYADAGVTRFAIGPQIGKEFDAERFAHNLRVALAAGSSPASVGVASSPSGSSPSAE